MDTKICAVCKIDKPYSDYTPRKNRKTPVQFACKKCNVDRFRLRFFGLSLDDYKQMISLQESKCKICGETTDDLCIDHCHDSGNVRGLLCRKCNSGIGLLQDSVILLESAINYLKESGYHR